VQTLQKITPNSVESAMELFQSEEGKNLGVSLEMRILYDSFGKLLTVLRYANEAFFA
jgi:hypothetical protein